MDTVVEKGAGEATEAKESREEEVDFPLYHLTLREADAHAELRSNGSMLVLKGSIASSTETQSFQRRRQEGVTSPVLRTKLLDKKILVKKNGQLELVKDYLFSAPSTAASVMLGRTQNGWVAWRDGKGRTLAENMGK